MLNQLTISEATQRLRKKDISAKEILQDCLQRIEQVDERLHTFLSYDQDNAVSQAEAMDKQIAQGNTNKPLLGIPIGIKDVLSVKDQPLNCASKILGNFRSVYDATVIQRLRDAGAIIFGRLNMDEFAMGSSTENSGFITTRNPWDLSRIPGGSSGGSAAAVAADECLAAIGSDTGALFGSRLPFAAALASSRPTAVFRVMDWWPLPRHWIRLGHLRSRLPIARG